MAAMYDLTGSGTDAVMIDGAWFYNVNAAEDNFDGWYCYTAITFVKDRTILSYCAGDKEIDELNRLKFLELLRDWLTSLSLE